VSAAWLTAFVALVGTVTTGMVIAVRWAWRILSRIMSFLDDYFGEAPREGVPARPGVMARLAAMERSLAEVQAETKPNGGHSLRDVVHRTANDVADIKADQAAMRQRMELFERQRENRERNGA
jgi:hypothetical protein